MQEAYRLPRSKCSLCYSVFGVGGGYPHPVLMVIPPSNLNGGGGGGLPHPVLTRGYPYPDLEPDLDRGTPPVRKDGVPPCWEGWVTLHQKGCGYPTSGEGWEYPLVSRTGVPHRHDVHENITFRHPLDAGEKCPV